MTIGAEKSFSYAIRNHEKPLSIEVTIHNSEFKNLPPEQTIGEGAVSSIILSQAYEPAPQGRVQIFLARQTTYRIIKEMKRLKIFLENQAEVISEEAAPAEAKALGSPSPPAVTPSSHRKDYIIGGGDILGISVYEEPDLTKTLRVSTNGTISFPLLGDLHVAGLTAVKVEKKLEGLLREGYLVNPQVSVMVKEYHSKEVFILGAVNKPGAYPLKRESTLLEVISRAGGILKKTEYELAGNSLILLRPGPSGEAEGNDQKGVKYFRVDLKRLTEGGDVSLNMVVQANDTIFIPRADTVFVFGQVKNPGAYKMVEKGMTVLEAVTMAGGLTRLAAASRTRVIRAEGGDEKTIRVNLNQITDRGDKSKDIVLEAGDVVVVPESFF